MFNQSILLLIVLAAAPNFVTATTKSCKIESPVHKVALMELFTSEGCSSCPPADKYISQLKAKGYTPNKIIPLSLHVDYWDYIGWQDPYANPQYTARQKAHAINDRRGAIYTPQFVVNGVDSKGWFASKRAFTQDALKINQQVPQADIKLALQQTSTSLLASASIELKHRDNNAVVYLALYENALASSVTDGENEGKQLAHDFVVRQLAGPFSTEEVKHSFTIKENYKLKNMGVVAFVQNNDDGNILQSVALNSCKK